jgi:hypothetical protein
MPSLEALRDALKPSDQKNISVGNEYSQSLTDRMSPKTKEEPGKREPNGILNFFYPNISDTERQATMQKAMEGMIREGAGGAATGLGSMLQVGKKIAPTVFENFASKLPGTVKDVAQYAGNTAKGAGIGAGMTEEPIENLEKSTVISAGLNALPLGLKQLGRYAEVINPKEHMAKISEKLKSYGEKISGRINEEYEPVEKTFNRYLILGRGHSERPIQKLMKNKSVNRYMKKYGGELYENFKSKPTYKNAHDLQSQLGSEIGVIQEKASDAESRAVMKGLQRGRNAINASLKEFLEERRPEFVEKIKRGSELTRHEKAPLGKGTALKEIQQGFVPKADKLLQALEKQEKKGTFKRRGLTEKRMKELGIEDEHPLAGIQRELKNKLEVGSAVNAATNIGVPALASSLLAGSFVPGVGHLAGALGGGVTGALAHKFAGHLPTELIQNPAILRLLMQMAPNYEKLVPQLIPPMGEYVGK